MSKPVDAELEEDIDPFTPGKGPFKNWTAYFKRPGRFPLDMSKAFGQAVVQAIRDELANMNYVDGFLQIALSKTFVEQHIGKRFPWR